MLQGRPGFVQVTSAIPVPLSPGPQCSAGLSRPLREAPLLTFPALFPATPPDLFHTPGGSTVPWVSHMLFCLSHPLFQPVLRNPQPLQQSHSFFYVPKPCESSHLLPELSSPLPRSLCWLPESILCSSPHILNLSLDVLHKLPCRQSLSSWTRLSCCTI